MFGKIENGVLVLAPKRIESDGMVCYNPNAKLLKKSGYLPIENTPYPDEGSYYESWEERDGVIIQVWVPQEQEENANASMTPEDRLCKAESELAALRRTNELLTAEVMYLCMMGGIEPMEVNT